MPLISSIHELVRYMRCESAPAEAKFLALGLDTQTDFDHCIVWDLEEVRRAALARPVRIKIRATSMVETRIALRHRVNKPAITEYGGDKYPRVVRDLSATGAAVEFSEPVKLLMIGRNFNLIIPDDGLKLACRIVWKGDYRMGITFE